MAECVLSATQQLTGTDLDLSFTLDGQPAGSTTVDLKPLLTLDFYSVGREETDGASQTIPHTTWTTITDLDLIFVNTTQGGGTYATLAADAIAGALTIQNSGHFISWGYLRWSNAEDEYSGTRSIRFARDVATNLDSTGKDDHVSNDGNTWHGHSWGNSLGAGTTMSLQAWHDSVDANGDPAEIEITTAQFKLMMVSCR